MERRTAAVRRDREETRIWIGCASRHDGGKGGFEGGGDFE